MLPNCPYFQIIQAISESIDLIRLLPNKPLEDRDNHDLDIQNHRPIADVFQIVVDAGFHFVDGFGFAAAAADLRQAGNAGLHFMAQHVALDLLAVVFVMGDGVRARADHGHGAGQHVQKLG